VQSILLAAGSESESLKRIAEKTEVDSRDMKILSQIALIYLPANLIAVCVAPISEKLNFVYYISQNKNITNCASQFSEQTFSRHPLTIPADF